MPDSYFSVSASAPRLRLQETASSIPEWLEPRGHGGLDWLRLERLADAARGLAALFVCFLGR